jgi:hypothetical protein
MGNVTASEHIARHIKELPDWRGKMLARLRKLILDAAPDLVEEWKWNTPVWSHAGNVLAAGSFKDHVKVNFFKGASLNDPKGLFNAGLDAKVSRAIDISKDDTLNETAFRELVRAAFSLNKTSLPATKKKPAKPRAK